MEVTMLIPHMPDNPEPDELADSELMGSLNEEFSPPALDVVITSGGTKVPIDVVRCLSNHSKGTTGSLLAEHALALGHSVRFICSSDSKQPYSSALILNPKQDLDQEFDRLRAIAEDYRRHEERLEVIEVRDFYEYHTTLKDHVSREETDVVILCMAASDYAPEQQDGKISSSTESLSLELKALPKLISEVKQYKRNVFLVGFKLLIGEDPDVVIEKAYRSMLRDGQDLAVANVGDSMNPESLHTYLVTIERGVIAVPREKLPEVLLQTLADRHSNEYYRTNHTRVDALPLEDAVVENYLKSVERLSKLALFNSYLRGSSEEFGFVATRTSEGTLITGRGSSKSAVTRDDIALVQDLDEEQRVLSVISTEKKASLNANVAHMIFQRRPDIQHIVHAHIPLAEAVATAHETAPGTQKDWELIKPLVEKGERLIYQPNHGVMILLESMDELIPLLEEHGIYNKHAEHYDTAYARFQKSKDFTSIVSQEVSINARVLDFACGTAEVSKELLSQGFSKLTLIDQSEAMLSVAREKLSGVSGLSFKKDSFEDFNAEEAYDAIVVRQAINYVTPDGLEQVFRQFHKALTEDGTLIFNTFSFDPMATPEHRRTRDLQGDKIIVTTEGNLIEGSRLHHGQRTEVFCEASGEYELFYDLNSFFIYSDVDFYDALIEAGFSDIDIVENGRSRTFIARK